MFVKMRFNLPTRTIVSTCGSQFGTMVGGLIALQGNFSPKPTSKAIGDLTYPGLFKASQSLVKHTPLTPLTPSRSILGEILKVTNVLFYVVGNNDYLQSQILAELKHIHGKMEALKSRLKVSVCHPLGKSLIAIMDGNSFSFKWKLDFVDGMKLKQYIAPHLLTNPLDKGMNSQGKMYLAFHGEWLYTPLGTFHPESVVGGSWKYCPSMGKDDNTP
jgi:hypothetical protein